MSDVVCLKTFAMRADMTKKRMKNVIEGTTTWIYGEKKMTFKNLRSFGYKNPCPYFHVPHITIGYSYE